MREKWANTEVNEDKIEVHVVVALMEDTTFSDEYVLECVPIHL